MSAPLPATEKERTHSRRPWLILGGIALVLVGVLGWLLFFHDAPRPDDSDMMPKWSAAEDKANPLVMFCTEIQKTSIRDFSTLSHEAKQLEPNASVEIQTFLETQSSAFAEFDKLMTSSQRPWQWPDVRGLAHPELPQPEISGYISSCMSMSAALRMKAQHYATNGEPQRAADTCINLAIFGEGMLQADGNSLHLLVALSAQRLGTTYLEKVLTNQPVSRDLVQHCLHELSRHDGLTPTTPMIAIKLSYLRARYILRESELRESHLEGYNPSSSNPPAMLRDVLFKPNLSLTMSLQHKRQFLAACAAGWKSLADAVRSSSDDLEALYAAEDTWKFRLDPNLTGKLMLIKDLEDLNEVIKKILSHQNARREFLIHLALRLHELDHGSLPTTLEALVPAYLPAVPLDVYSGEPMLWNARSQVVYSLGRNGIDDGGKISERNPDGGDDSGRKYLWGKPPVAPSKP